MASQAYQYRHDAKADQPITGRARRRRHGRLISKWHIDQVLKYVCSTLNRRMVIFAADRRDIRSRWREG